MRDLSFSKPARLKEFSLGHKSVPRGKACENALKTSRIFFSVLFSKNVFHTLQIRLSKYDLGPKSL